MTKVLYLVRHGLTDWNVQRKMQGHSNIPINEIGREQAKALQKFFAETHVDHIFSSDLDRAFQTIEIATETLLPKREIRKLASLREVNLGSVEGITQAEIIEKFGLDSWNQWTSLAADANFTYPGGETHLQSRERMLEALKHIFTEFEFQTAVACTHGLLIRRIAHHLKPEMNEPIEIEKSDVD
ncbi:MAG: histidine phosphatase family protein, partial [Proteobacteria bacterium]